MMTVRAFTSSPRRWLLSAAIAELALSSFGCTREAATSREAATLREAAPAGRPARSAESAVSRERSPESAPSAAPEPALREPDVPYEPSAPQVVRVMLELGKVSASDVVYDLGCGDGRIVIAAVKERGARGVCIDIDPQRIRESRENARRAGVEDRIRFATQDLFEADIAEASVVMLFLWPEINLRLRPKLLAELRPGSRVVSHWHDMGDWKPEQRIQLTVDRRKRSIYGWSIPPAVSNRASSEKPAW